jgi:hypothetical protein
MREAFKADELAMAVPVSDGTRSWYRELRRLTGTGMSMDSATWAASQKFPAVSTS